MTAKEKPRPDRARPSAIAEGAQLQGNPSTNSKPPAHKAEPFFAELKLPGQPSVLA
jgi:hypothetical protein